MPNRNCVWNVSVQRAAEEAERQAGRKRARNCRSKARCCPRWLPCRRTLTPCRQKVAQIEEGRKHEMGALGEQLKGLGEQQARSGPRDERPVVCIAQQQGAWRVGRGAAAQHRGIGGSAGTCRFRHPGGGHRRRWAYAAAGYGHPHAGRQNHSDRREGAIRRLPARMRDSRHRLAGGTGPQERSCCIPMPKRYETM